MATDSDSQSAIFWDRFRLLFSPNDDEASSSGGEPQRGLVITVCVFLSFILWLSLTLSEQRSETLRLPVEVVQIPEGQALAEVPPSTVRVQMQASGLELIRLLYNLPVVEVEGTSGQVDVRESITLAQSSDVTITRVSPASFQMELEPIHSRKVPVRSRVHINLEPAYELTTDPTLRPDSIEVRGAESVLASLAAWPTDSVQIDNLQDTIRVRVPLADTLNRLVERSAEQVTFVARAGRFAEESREVRVEVRGAPPRQNLVVLEPSTIRIRYRVLFDQLFQARRSSGFFATVSYDQIRSDTTGYVEPQVHVPSELLIRDPEPIPSRLRYYTYLSGN